MKREEVVSSISHFFGFLLSLIGTAILILGSEGNFHKIIISLVYGLSTASLFLLSTLYHYFKKRENENSIWRRLDHTAIFFMIAGAYTPVCYYRLSGTLGLTIILLQWGLTFLGIFFKFFYLNAPRYLSTFVYLLMGWMGVVIIRQLFIHMSYIELVFLVLGSFSYTIGAIFYMLKRPKLKPWFGFHEIFHIFVLLGAFFHYLMIYHIILTS